MPGPSTSPLDVAMGTSVIPYKRRLRIGALTAIGILCGFMLLTLGLSPVDTVTKKVFLALTAVAIGALGLVAVRRNPVAPCPSCKAELYWVITAAQRAGKRLSSCPNCGHAVDV